MTSEYDLVLVPRIGANDDHALLIAWSKGDGERVEADEVLCELEFSKSVIEVPASRAGWLFHHHKEGEEVRVGAPLAAISERAERPLLRDDEPSDASTAKITAKARKLIEMHGLDVAVFQGIDIVKERHVEEWIEKHRFAADEAPTEGELVPLSPIRRRAAQTLTESKQTVPHSYVSRWLAAERVDARVDHAAASHDMMLSVSDWLVAALARQVPRHRKVNASWRGNGIFVHARTNVGFALNQASGDLLVPVIQDADRLDLEGLVGRIRGLQKKALRHKLAPEDLSGGTITATSLTGTGVHQVFPILVPGQAIIVAIGDRCAVGGAPTYALTAAFDHRVLNGTEAAEFLAAVAGDMEGAEASQP